MTNRAATVQVIDALNASGIPYMVVGSLSSNVYGVERATKDADFVVDTSTVPISAVTKRLGPEFIFDPQMSFETAMGTSRWKLTLEEPNPFTFEFFLLSDDAHDRERFARRKRVRVMEREAFVPTAEDVVVMKVRWGRAKDREDVKNVLGVMGDELDWDYIHRWCDLHGSRVRLDEIRRTIPVI